MNTSMCKKIALCCKSLGTRMKSGHYNFLKFRFFVKS